MINFMLNDLCGPSAEVFRMRFHFNGFELHFYCFISLALTRSTEERQTSFFGFVDAGACDNFRVEHHSIRRSPSALVKKGDAALGVIAAYTSK